MLKVKYSYNFLTKANKEMRPNVSYRANFFLFIVKFKKLGFSAPLSAYCIHYSSVIPQVIQNM